MMKLTVPKNQSQSGARIFYVTSESGGERHIVVAPMCTVTQDAGVYFCDCKDFFVRHLTEYGTPSFSPCKHGEFVRDVLAEIGPDETLVSAVSQIVKPGKSFGVFYHRGDGYHYRSHQAPQSFDSRESAHQAIDEIRKTKPHFGYINYYVKEL